MSVRIARLYLYPIKSCAAVALDECRVLATGLAHDREWMVVDAQGEMLTQRTQPRMALVRARPDGALLRVAAPGMPPLDVPMLCEVDQAGRRVDTGVWRDRFAALDCGPQAAQWFSAFLGQAARLLRFDPAVARAVSPTWLGGRAAQTLFADGYPLMVLGSASLDDLNRRLAARGVPAVDMLRFRPNLVLEGLEPYEEDYLGAWTIGTQDGEVRLQMAKPCTRCPVPNVDPARGAPDPRWPDEPMASLAEYRRDARVRDQVSFGRHAIVTAGAGARLACAQRVDSEYDFAS